MIRSVVFAIAATVAFGCGSGQTRPSTPRAFVDATYATLRGSSFEPWLALNAEDAVFISSSGFRLDREQARTALERNFGDLLRAGATIAIESRGPARVRVSPTGEAAWITDNVELRIAVPNDTPAVASLRLTQVVARRAGRWWLVASHWSVAQDEHEVATAIASGSWPSPERIGTRIAPDAAPLLALTEQLADDPGDADVIDWTAARGELRKAIGVKLAGGVAGAIVPSGDLGWIAGQFEVLVGQVRVPIRILTVYIREKGRWRLVQWHASIPAPRT